MNSIDSNSLKVEKLIRSHLLYENYKKIDLVGVFFHELMIYATNYYIMKTSKEKYLYNINFPFLNSQYIEENYLISFENITNRKKNKKYKLIEILQKLFSFKSICIEDNVAINVRELILKNFFKFRFYQSLNNKLFIENEQIQLRNLKSLLEKIADCIDVSKKENFVANFLEYIKLHLSKEPVKAEHDILFVGSNAKLTSRINSAIYLSQGKKVISFCHGEHSIYVLDEPIIGYAELSYCSDYVTYGKEQDFDKLSYAKPLYSLPRIFYRSSNIIEKYYSDIRNRTSVKIDSNLKILYIPTLFSGNQRYGPFRDIEDRKYKNWQESILKLDYKITYKSHPKSKVDLKLNCHNIVTKNLKDILLEYDLYILDYVSTASALCIATDKPIIYFNLGMRNLQENVKNIMKNRVFWVDINMEKDLNVQIVKAINDFNYNKRNFTNEYTNRYSLNDKKNYLGNII